MAQSPAEQLRRSRGALIEIGAPVDGIVLPLTEIPDKVFSQGLMGPGIGIRPSDPTICAPADATVVVAQETGHAFDLALASGVELLIHVGIDTVNLGGEGFDVHLQAGDKVLAGTPLVTFDRALIERAGFSLVTPVLVTNAYAFGEVSQVAEGKVRRGHPVITVAPKV